MLASSRCLPKLGLSPGSELVSRRTPIEVCPPKSWVARRSARMRYELYYWPSIQGRGEFVRLALEEAGANYLDVARGPERGRGVPALLHLLDGETIARPPFAPPVLKAGKLIIAQTSNILMYLGTRHRLAPASEAGRMWALQLQLTIADLVQQAHDTQPPNLRRPVLRGAASRGPTTHRRISEDTSTEVPWLLRACTGPQPGQRPVSDRGKAHIPRSLAVSGRRRVALCDPARNGSLREEASSDRGLT